MLALWHAFSSSINPSIGVYIEARLCVNSCPVLEATSTLRTDKRILGLDALGIAMSYIYVPFQAIHREACATARLGLGKFPAFRLRKRQW